MTGHPSEGLVLMHVQLVGVQKSEVNGADFGVEGD